MAHADPTGSTTPESITALLLDQADRLFGQHVTPKTLDEADSGVWPAALWQAVSEAGLPLALVPDELGGVGLAPADAMLLVRRAAYHTVPLPLGEAMIASALWAAASGEPPPGGVITFAASPGPETVSLRRTPDGVRLDGRLDRVPWGTDADHVLVHARDEAGRGHLALMPRSSEPKNRARRNVAYEPRPNLLLDGLMLPADAVREAQGATSDGLLVFGALLRSQGMVGAMERGLDHALLYANERSQFGRAIGKFQAVQHMLAEAAGHAAAATAAADGAAEAWGRPDFRFATALAKARTGEAAGRVAAVCHQVLGAMGITQEHPLHHATRRLWSWRDEFGADAWWEEEIGRLVCAGGGQALWDTLVRVTQRSASAPT